MDLSQIKTNVQVADDCMAVIAGVSATSVKGVVSLSSGITKKVLPFIETNNLKKGVEVVQGEDGLDVNLSVTIKQGFDVEDVCTKVQEKIIEGLESMLSLKVNSVTVRVAGIEVPKNE